MGDDEVIPNADCASPRSLTREYETANTSVGLMTLPVGRDYRVMIDKAQAEKKTWLEPLLSIDYVLLI